MYETEQEIEKVILVAVCSNPNQDPEESLDELEELVKTAGATVVGRMIQNLEHASSATYIGSGKVEELKDLIWETEATAVVCDDELTPAQYKNLEDELDVKVMDRTLIILDIFAGRAKSAESGRACPASLPLHKTYWYEKSFTSGWWYRYKRSRRKEA